jgi:hypothetical protein
MLDPDIGENDNNGLDAIVNKYSKNQKREEPASEKSDISDSDDKKKSVKPKNVPKNKIENADKEDKIKNTDLQEFKAGVRSWVDIDDKIKTLQRKMKELRDEKKPYEDQIMTFMEKHCKNTIQFSTGKLKLNKSESKTPLKMDYIKNVLSQHLHNSEKVGEVSKTLENRPIIEKIKLRRTKADKEK